MYAIYGSETPTFLINDHIGYDDDIKDENGLVVEKGDGQGIDGKLFGREFFEVDATHPKLITYYVNSQGGDVFQGWDIMTAIVASKSKTKSIISGVAASTAGWLALLADKVEMWSNGIWMCHFPYDPTDSTVSPFLKMVANSIATTISEKSGRNDKPKKSVSEVLEMMKSKTYLNATQMHEQGLVDIVIDSNSEKVDAGKTNKEIFNQFKIILNKEFNNKNQNTMAFEKVINRLGLASGSGEDDMIQGIARLENKIKNQETDIADKQKMVDEVNSKKDVFDATEKELRKKLKEAEDAKNEAENKCVNLQKTYDEMDAENKATKEKLKEYDDKEKIKSDSEKKEKAENLVKHAIKLSKLTASDTDAISLATKMAIENYDQARLMLLGGSVVIPMPKSVDGSNQSAAEPKSWGDKFRALNCDNRKVIDEKKVKIGAASN